MSDKHLRCSFCGKSKESVKKFISGPNVYICNECISLCNEILAEEEEREAQDQTVPSPTPQEIKATLDQYVIGQEAAKRTMAVSVYNHYKRVSHHGILDDVEIDKANILLIGPTGVGKTLLAQTLARTLHVPFTIADATTLTEAGYVGEDVENILVRLLQAADFNVAECERGIVYIDEIDKIASVPPQGGRKHPQQEYIQINTRNILFICGGAFDGLEKIVEARVGKGQIGFGGGETQTLDGNLLEAVEPEDLQRYGLIPEIVGRLPVSVHLDQLDEEALTRILQEPKNALVKQYEKMFELEGIGLRFDPEAIGAIARRTLDRDTGARGLRSIIESAMRDIMFELPSRDDVREVVITRECIEDGVPPLLVLHAEERAMEA